MSLTESVNDVVAQAAGLLAPVDMSDWSPPADAPADAVARLEQEEYDRRAQKRIDDYLADRSDRLICLKAIRQAAEDRANAYEAQAAPWQRMADRQKRLKAYVEQLGRNVLEAERKAAGFGDDEPYEVTAPNGVKFALALSPPALQCSVDDLPRRYIETCDKPKTDEIKRALKAGLVVPGAKLTRGLHVRWGR